jgi:hypothetical protein
MPLFIMERNLSRWSKISSRNLLRLLNQLPDPTIGLKNTNAPEMGFRKILKKISKKL